MISARDAAQFGAYRVAQKLFIELKRSFAFFRSTMGTSPDLRCDVYRHPGQFHYPCTRDVCSPRHHVGALVTNAAMDHRKRVDREAGPGHHHHNGTYH